MIDLIRTRDAMSDLEKYTFIHIYEKSVCLRYSFYLQPIRKGKNRENINWYIPETFINRATGSHTDVLIRGPNLLAEFALTFFDTHVGSLCNQFHSLRGVSVTWLCLNITYRADTYNLIIFNQKAWWKLDFGDTPRLT